MRAPSQTLSPTSGTAHCCFARSPRSGPISTSSTMWTSCAGTAPRPPSPISQLDWTRRLPKLGDRWHAVPGARRFSDPRRGDNQRYTARRRIIGEIPFMTSSSIGKHARSGPASDQPAVPEPAFGERARTLMYVGRIGSLSTLSRRQSGFPFGSVMPYGLDDHGRPIFLISTMAMHTQNLQADPRASLLVTRDFAHIESQEATMTAVDRLGFHVRVKTQDGMRGARVAFLREASNPAETRKVLVEMVQQARSQAE